MQVVSAFQLLNGFKINEKDTLLGTVSSSLVQPIQMLPYDEKTDAWRAWNMDWLESHGTEQIRLKQKSLTKDYELAAGILDKNDYVNNDLNENKDLIDALISKSDPPEISQLQFYPLIPNVVDLLCGEFIKRNNKVIPYAVDQFSKNEKLEKKKELVDQILIQQAQMEIMENLIQMGADLNDEEIQQQLLPENVKTLPDVERYMRKDFRTTFEQWASHQIQADTFRFRMNELEEIGFRDSLIADQEFWEIQLMEDDYAPKVLDPRSVFFHKTKSTKYTCDGNFAGYVEIVTISDVIDSLGWKMTEEEIKSLESISPTTTSNFLLNQPNDGSYYDPTKSYEENVKTGSLQYKQLMAFEDVFGTTGNRTSHQLFDFLIDENGSSSLRRGLLKKTTGYWKSQKRVGHLTKILDSGEMVQMIVTEDFQITDKPLYDTTFFKEKTKDNLIFGEHVDWIWVNEVWGGIKISTDSPTTLIQSRTNGFNPIYLGIGDKRKPDRLPFQFKGRDSLYGAALPIIGFTSSDRTAKSMSPVRRMKPFQIGYNFVNNQMSDILIDEMGPVIVIDHNMLPQNSMGESWGKNNLAKAYTVMKNFQILPLDTSLTNTENVTHFNNMQRLDLSQTERLLGRAQLAEYFKTQAFATIGITPERMGSVNSQQTATGTQISVNNSYAQTEKYFTQHSDYLMPRVWEMILNASQYYTSTIKKSTTLSYRNERDEDVLFSLDDTRDIFMRDIDVYCTTSFEKKEIKRKLEQLAIENNTSGATIYDLGKILMLDTPSEIMDALKESELKMQRLEQERQQHEQQLQEQQIQAAQEQDMRNKEFEASENEKDRRAKLLSDQIRAAGYPDTSDNGEDEYLKRLSIIQGQTEYQETMDFKREQENNKMSLERDKMNLAREELSTRRQISADTIEVARENKTNKELEVRRKAKEQKKKKK